MERAAGGLDAIAGLHQRVIPEEASVLDRAADPHQILHHDPSSTQIEMANFAIAHLSVGQAHRPSRRRQQRARLVGPDAIPIRRVRQEDCVRLTVFPIPPTIEDNECDGTCRSRGHQAIV